MPQELSATTTENTTATTATATTTATASIKNPFSQYNKYAGLGLTGLSNLGNTCFANSCIQMLSHTYELNEFLEAGTYKRRVKQKPDTILLNEWDKLRQLMWSENCTVSPGGFIRSMQHVAKIKKMELFASWNQNDVPEFLMFMIESFHNALSRPVTMNVTGNVIGEKDVVAKKCYEMMKNMYEKDYSEMLNIFYGIQMSVITAKPSNGSIGKIGNQHILTLKPEPFFIVNLPIPFEDAVSKTPTKCPTLLDCFECYCKPEALDGDNAWFNEKTGKKQDVEKRILFWNMPNVLVIDLKRFVYTETGTMRKIQVPVEIPISGINLGKYIQGYNAASGYIYDLYGVCNHHGNIYGGHYTATIRTADGKWYNFNDTTVKELDITGNTIISNTPYCLFYRKRK